MKSPEDPREQKALEALLTAALHPFGLEDDVTEQEVVEFLQSMPPLTSAQQAALDSLGQDPLQWVTCERTEDRSSAKKDADVFAAMYRHGSDEGLDEETRREIERKRQEVLKKLASRKKQQ